MSESKNTGMKVPKYFEIRWHILKKNIGQKEVKVEIRNVLNYTKIKAHYRKLCAMSTT